MEVLLFAVTYNLNIFVVFDRNDFKKRLQLQMPIELAINSRSNLYFDQNEEFNDEGPRAYTRENTTKLRTEFREVPIKSDQPQVTDRS